jgi:hypothetical protein
VHDPKNTAQSVRKLPAALPSESNCVELGESFQCVLRELFPLICQQCRLFERICQTLNDVESRHFSAVTVTFTVIFCSVLSHNPP